MSLKSQPAFTLIELVIVIALLGILAAAAIPRMMSSYDSAHESAVTATGGALASAVILARSQWISNGAPGAVDALKGYGLENIATSTEGWPTDGGQGVQSNHSTIIANDAERCIRLWRALLVDNAPKVGLNAADEKYDFVVEAPTGALCRFTYNRNELNSRIEYNLASGSVVTIL